MSSIASATCHGSRARATAANTTASTSALRTMTTLRLYLSAQAPHSGTSGMPDDEDQGAEDADEREPLAVRDAHLAQVGRQQREDLADAETLDHRGDPEDRDEDAPVLAGTGLAVGQVTVCGEGHPPSLAELRLRRDAHVPDTRKRPKELVGTSVRRVRRLRTSPQSLVVAGSLARRPCDLRTWFPGPSRGSLLEPVWRFNLPLRARRNVRPGPTAPTTGLSTNLQRDGREVIPELARDVDGLWIHSSGRYRMGRLLARLVAAQDGWAQPLGDFNHRWLSALFRPIRPIKDFLNGTWLGHPLHAAVTDIPIGALLLTVILDILGQPAAADIALVATILFMLPPRCRAPPTTSTPTARPATRATVHSTLMVVGARAPARLARAPRDRRRPTGRSRSPSSIIGFLIVTAGAFVGGDVVYVFGNMVSRHAFRGAGHEVDPPRHRRRHRPRDAARRRRRPRRRPASTTSSSSGSATTVHALHAVCAHAGGPLAAGHRRRRLHRVPVARLALPADRRPRPPRAGRLRPAGVRDPGRRGRRLRGPAPADSRCRRHHRPRWPRSSSPDPSLVVLVGAAGAGKSTFAARHFAPDEILSSDRFRAIVSGDEANQAATQAAFSVLHRGAASRASASGRLTVVDATNVEAVGSPRAAGARARGRRPGRRDRPRPAGRHGPRAERGASRPGRRQAVVRRHLGRLRASLDGPGPRHRRRGLRRDRRPARPGRGRPRHDPPRPAGRPRALGRARPRCRRSPPPPARSRPRAIAVTRSRRKTAARMTVVTG